MPVTDMLRVCADRTEQLVASGGGRSSWWRGGRRVGRGEREDGVHVPHTHSLVHSSGRYQPAIATERQRIHSGRMTQ